MTVHFDAPMPVHYGQFYVDSRVGGEPDDSSQFTRQTNGLCGAASAGSLFLVTATHTGAVGLTVEELESEPNLSPEWEEVVEVSYHPKSPTSLLRDWHGEIGLDLALPEVWHRVRYSGRGLDVARDAEIGSSPEDLIDHYLLQFWPAPAAEDAIVTRTSDFATYCHQTCTLR